MTAPIDRSSLRINVEYNIDQRYASVTLEDINHVYGRILITGDSGDLNSAFLIETLNRIFDLSALPESEDER